MHRCFRRRTTGSTDRPEGTDAIAAARFTAAGNFGFIGPQECPNIHALTLPGHFGSSSDFADYDVRDYEVKEVADENVIDSFLLNDGAVEKVTPEFAIVSDRRGLQRELRRGTSHIVVTQHIDLTRLFLPDLSAEFGALDNAAVRVMITTLSIVVRS